VLGIEARLELVDRSIEILGSSAIDPDRYEFICADLFEALESMQESFDTVLCLDLLDHVVEHCRLMRLMAELCPRAIIIDTTVLPDEQAVIQLRTETTEPIDNAVPRHAGQQDALVGRVSRGALPLLAQEVGYSIDYLELDSGAGTDDRETIDRETVHREDGIRVSAVLQPLPATERKHRLLMRHAHGRLPSNLDGPRII
jgi:hypothetical protein